MKDEIQREINCINNSYRMPIPKYFISLKKIGMASKSVAHEMKNQFVKHIHCRVETEKLKDDYSFSKLRK